MTETIPERLDREAKRLLADRGDAAVPGRLKVPESFVSGVEHAATIAHRMQWQVVSLADVTAALVACYPSTVGNATDIGVRLGVRGVAEWLGVDLDAARAADGQEG